MAARAALIELVNSLTLADHLGEAIEDGVSALKKIGIDIGEWNDKHEISHKLGKMKLIDNVHDPTDPYYRNFCRLCREEFEEA